MNLPAKNNEADEIIVDDKTDIIIENTLYHALDLQPFIGNMLQILQIKWSSMVPTAAIYYDVSSKSFCMLLNKEFLKPMSTEERTAIFFHEIYHVLHKHLTSIAVHKYTASEEERTKWNISMDMAINQFIENLPKQCFQPANFKDVKGNALKLEMPFEYYYEETDWSKIIQPNNCPVHGTKGAPQSGNSKGAGASGSSGQQESQEDQGEGQGAKDGQAQGEGKEQPGEASGESQGKPEGQGEKGGQGQHKHNPNSKHKCTCKHKLVDDHDIMNQSNGDASEEEMLKAMGDLFRRTMQKTQYGYSQTPKFVQDLLNDIDKRLSAIDYKRILAKAIKKSLPSYNRQNTWHKPSKRFGYIAPGTKDGNVCNVHIMVDSSGSISIDEMNVFLGEVDAILKNLKTNVMLHLFHTNVYQSVRFKRNYGIEKLSLQSGGTDLLDCFIKMQKQPADLVVFLTDGYYSGFQVPYKPHFQTIFCISKGGDINHSLKHIGETLQIK